MNSATLRSKRVLLPTVAAVLALGIGGVAWASAANAGDLRGSERDRVANAATRAVGGTATEVEVSDDLGEYYEVEVRRDDGTEVDVSLDKDLKVVGRDVDDRDDDFDDFGDFDDDRDDDADDRALSASERTSAENAARNAVGGGTVTEVEAGDGFGEAYEVEVLDRNRLEWDVELDADFKVLSKTVDD
jgi:uncharacterized membrane protein YkoI